MKTLLRFSFLSTLLLVASGCTFTSKADDFNGLPGVEGKPVTHINQSKLSLTFFMGMAQLIGDASLESTVADLTAEAKADGASAVRIVQSEETLHWWWLGPFTILFTPMYTNVAADCAR